MIELLAPDGDVVEKLEGLLEKYKPHLIYPTAKKTITYEQFLKRPLPHMDIPFGNAGIEQRRVGGNGVGKDMNFDLSRICEGMGYGWCSNFNIMAASTQMPRHTNSNHKGWRVYYTKGGGVFKYIDENGEQQVSEDNAEGWTCRRFKIRSRNPLWHSVYARNQRIAFGFGKKF
jgi:hypothetical protein